MVLAVCGIERNVGTTHFSFALSNYLCNKLGKRVAYLEVNATDEISALCPDRFRSDSYFPIHGIHLYPRVTIQALPIMLTLSYDFFILDFGVLNPHTSREFIRADFRFILGYCSPWKVDFFSDFLERMKAYHVLEKTLLLEPNNYCVKKRKPAFAKRYQIDLLSIPFLENPFQFTTLDLAFYKELISKFLFIPQARRRFL